MPRFARDPYDDFIDASSETEHGGVCGVLAGVFHDRESVVTGVYPTENVANQPTARYAINPDGLYDIFEVLEAAGEEVVGLERMHPRGPPDPTKMDDERAGWRE